MRKTNLFTLFSCLICFFLTLSTLDIAAQWKIVEQGFVFSDAPFKQCHASSLLEVEPNRILVACFGGAYEGDKSVAVWVKEIGKTKEGTIRKVADGKLDDVEQFPAWNPVLFKNSEGLVYLFYKVGPNPREWWGMFKVSADNGASWSGAIKLPNGILGPIKNKPVQLKDGSILAPSSVEETTGKWKVHLERSTDNGKTWAKVYVDTVSDLNVIQPSVLHYADGRLQILCRSKEGRVMQSWSADQGLTWSKLSKTSLLNPNSGTDAVTLKDGTQLIVYNPDLPGKDWFNGRSKLHLAASYNGLDWKDVMVLEDGTNEEFSYPAIIQTEDGSVYISYTYDRKNIKYVIVKNMPHK